MEKHHLDANQSSVQLLAFNTNGRNFATFLSPKSVPPGSCCLGLRVRMRRERKSDECLG